MAKWHRAGGSLRAGGLCLQEIPAWYRTLSLHHLSPVWKIFRICIKIMSARISSPSFISRWCKMNTRLMAIPIQHALKNQCRSLVNLGRRTVTPEGNYDLSCLFHFTHHSAGCKIGSGELYILPKKNVSLFRCTECNKNQTSHTGLYWASLRGRITGQKVSRIA